MNARLGSTATTGQVSVGDGNWEDRRALQFWQAV